MSDYTIKNVELHNLVRIVFGGLSYGIADELLEEDGLFAFGRNTPGEEKVNGHHIGSKYDNSPENTELVSTRVHTIIDNAPRGDAAPAALKKFFHKYTAMAAAEEPQRMSVLITNEKLVGDEEVRPEFDYRLIYGTTELEFSDRAARQLMHLHDIGLNQWLLNQAVETTLQILGVEVFEYAEYLVNANGPVHKCRIEGDELFISEIKNDVDLINSRYILYYLDSDNGTGIEFKNMDNYFRSLP